MLVRNYFDGFRYYQLCESREGVIMEENNKQSQYSMKYDRSNTQRIYLKFNLKTDADILEKLDSVKNKQGYIKDLIRKDIENSK